MAGICRGGQFLNVMNGGKMWQHVNNHAMAGVHPAENIKTGEVIDVTSTHHQMMRPSEQGVILLTASLSTRKETATERVLGKKESDIESVFYPKTNNLCFQPHPEYVSVNHPCQVLFFRYLKECLNLS
jgi:gamma-glutamyl-gamma-aminobutyrate hydrolase PuuD